MSYNNGLYTGTLSFLPAQMLPMKEKDLEWKKDNMDALESLGRNQYNVNLSLIENYEMIKGRFISSHYFGDSGYTSMLQSLSQDFELPNYLRHYDIISRVVNSLSAKYQARPDIFKIRAEDEESTNEFLRKKTELLHNYINSNVQFEIQSRLSQMGLTGEQQFQSQEEQQAFQQLVEKTTKMMTPPQIEKYMSTDFRTVGEIWGQARLNSDKQRFDLKEKEKKEFEDMLIADRCFRHFFLTANGYDQETWNPIQVFFHKSPDIDYVEDGDYVGRVFILTIHDIINRYGHRLTKEQLDTLVEESKKTKQQWNEASGYDYVYKEYMYPFKGYPAYDILRNTATNPLNPQSSDIPFLDNSFFSGLSSGRMYQQGNGYYWVTEAYWFSQKKYGLVTYIDDETGLQVSKIVDENFIVPKGFVELDDKAISDEPEVNTIIWSWKNEGWGGIKINMGNRSNSLYLGFDDSTEPNPMKFQFKGDINPYACKHPVCGRVFSIRNSRSMSLVDLMKPFQIGYNVAMNQLYQLMEKEVGAFLIFDVNMFPNSKDWGGSDSWDKWMLLAKSIGMLPADTSPQNVKGSLAASGGQYPKVLNMELASQMVSRMNIANAFEQKALSQIGFNSYAMGNYTSEATASGIQQGVSASELQTESYFTNFSNYLKRVYRMNIEIAQYVESKNRDVTVQYTNSDLSKSFIKVLGTDLLLRDLHIYVENSQEVIRQLEMLREYALHNNTAGTTVADVADIITMNSPSQIKAQLKLSVKKQQELMDRQSQIQEKTLEQTKELELMKAQKEDERLDKELQNNLDVAQLQAQSKILLNRNYVPEDSDIQNAKLNMEQSSIEGNLSLQQQKHQLEREKAIADKDLELKKLALENKKIDTQLAIENKNLEIVKAMKKETKKK